MVYYDCCRAFKSFPYARSKLINFSNFSDVRGNEKYTQLSQQGYLKDSGHYFLFHDRWEFDAFLIKYCVKNELKLMIYYLLTGLHETP